MEAIKHKSTATKKTPVRYYTTEASVHMFNDLLVPYDTYFRSPIAKLGAIKEGLQPGALTDLLQLTGVTQADVAQWLDITEPTLRKHMQSTKELNPGLSEHVIQLFELFNKGLDTFGSLDEFKSWLRHHNIGIDAVPFDLLDTITGISIIMTELGRIDHGILA